MEKILGNIKRQFSEGNILNRLIWINIAVFIVLFVVQLITKLFLLQGFDLTQYIGLSSDLGSLWKVWTIFTYMFVHLDLWHIFFNMLLLYMFGQLFVSSFNYKQLGSLYFLGGVAGGLLFLIAYNLIPYYVETAGNSLLIGASGAVMAIIFGISFYRPDFKVRLFFVIDIKLIYLALGLFILDFIALTSSNAGGAIAHIGGAAMGILFAQQMKQGKDITKFITHTIDNLVGLFKKGPRKPSGKFTGKFQERRDAYNYNARKKEHNEQIDKILDKIKASGYNSLTKDEKKQLFDASNQP